MSILIVILHHLEFKGFIVLPNSTPVHVLGLLFDGQFGVNVFFVVSGFLITSLLLSEEQKTGWVSLKNFYIRRTLRIFPAYYFMLIVYFLLQLAGIIKIPNLSWLTAITYTKYFNSGKEWYTAHAWSLSIEEQFYLFWPFVFRSSQKLRKIAPWLMILVVILYKLLFPYIYPNHWRNDTNILARIDSIAIGCLFAIHRDKILKTIRPYWRLVILGSVLMIVCLKLLEDLTPTGGFVQIFLTLFGSSHGTLADFAIAFLIFYSVFGPINLWFKTLNTRVLNYIGLLSYSIYLWQQFFLNKTTLIVNQFPLNLILIAGAAVFSYYIIEKPFLNLKSRFSNLVTRSVAKVKTGIKQETIVAEKEGLEPPLER